MSDEHEYLRSGAYNDGLDGGEEERYRDAELYDDSPLPPGLAGRIADGILSEPRMGREGAAGDGWDMKRDAEPDKPRPRKPTAWDRINSRER